MTAPLKKYLKSIKFEHKISFTYFLLGILWILFSDEILNSAISDAKLLASIQTYKGLFYIFITTFLLFFLVKSHIEKLKNQQILFQTVFDTIPESVVITNTNRELIMVNKEAYRKFSKPNNTPIGSKTNLFYESDSEYDQVGNLVFNKHSKNKKSIYTINYKDNKDRIFPGETFSAKLFDSKKEWIGNLAIIRDITERNKVAAELNDSQAKLNTALKNMADAVFISDAEGKNISFNDAFAPFHKFNDSNECPEELYKYVDFLDVYMPNGKLATSNEFPIRRALNGENGTNEEFKLVRKDTGVSWIGSYSFAPIRNKKGTIIGAVVVARDITKQKIAQEELIKAKEKAEESDRTKTIFLQNVSHEIRTPLNAIIGFSELLCEENLDEIKQLEFKNIILNSSYQLLSIVSDILTASALLTQQVKLTYTTVNVNAIIKELHSVFQNKANSKGIELNIDMLQNEDIFLSTDETKFRQILTNLISNALKFTTKGAVVIGYQIHQKQIVFHIKDSGIGIKKELQEKIFERFHQGDNSISVNYGGTGLGLAISKDFAELLGGQIELESVEGLGTTFYFSLPIA